jgi:hypothetical protein
MSDTPSPDVKELQTNNVTKPPSPRLFIMLKQYAKNVKKEWGPLLAAKEHLDDEYNFPPGRYAGQGVEFNKR